MEDVKVWEEDVIIPTYGIGEPEKHPMFLEKRVYQGSSGVVYPYPVIEKIKDEKEDKSYHAVFLENEYLKIMVLPELGGRVQMAFDKIKNRHFIYYNHVIKPALVGLTGPWISGGIEFNWPQHHRPSTFLPVDFKIEKREDGSAVVWVSERERMFHQKGMAGFVLRPGKAVLEIIGKLYNPTPVPQTFLWWANPAVAVNDFYQSVFPDDVNAVFDHGKRDVSKYPIATGVYYKMDYSAGVDISRYKNIPVPTSYMAIQSKYDFVGGYENDTRAGVLHVADHHVSPGKKQWTWGCSDFGKAWDRNLTDEDGPYIELMTGVYTDNQPDFTWLQPYEEKTFVQYFMPYRELGVVKNATSDLLMNIEPSADRDACILKLFATSLQKGLRITVTQSGKKCFEDEQTLSPEKVYEAEVNISSLGGVSVDVFDKAGKSVLSWQPESDAIKPIPDPAMAALPPSKIDSPEELYLTGLHLEQYRHATYNPTDYYLEALKHHPEDIRNNNAMGLWLIRKGKFAEAEKYLRTAVKTITRCNPNPYDGEPYYNLGISLKYQGRLDEAYDCFYKSCWNSAWQDSGYFALAQISASEGKWERALEEIDKSLLRNWHNVLGRHLKTVVLRHAGRTDEALKLIADSVAIEPFNFGCLFEECLITSDKGKLEALNGLMRYESRNYEELFRDYADAGCWEEALNVAETAVENCRETSPILHYYKAWALAKLGKEKEACEEVHFAESLDPGCFFQNSLDDILVMEKALELVPDAAKALYYLGNIWYDKRQYSEAVSCWEASAGIDDGFPTVLRNLSLAYFNKLGRKEEAVALLERAYSLDEGDARILMELDQLYKRLGKPYSFRAEFLERHMDAVLKRDDLYLEYATLLNQLGKYEQAMDLIDSRIFHPWEGGEGKVPAQYQISHLELAKKYISEEKYAEALELVEQCYDYPHNLGEGKLKGAQENDFNYFKALILRKMGNDEAAKEVFEAASVGLSQPAAAMYYNDQKPDKIFYQGMALMQLGRESEARSRFNSLISYGEKHLYDVFTMDYFAVSLPDLQIWEDDMNVKNTIHCNYLMALGYMGLGDKVKAAKYFDIAASLDINHQGVQIHRNMLNQYCQDK